VSRLSAATVTRRGRRRARTACAAAPVGGLLLRSVPRRGTAVADPCGPPSSVVSEGAAVFKALLRVEVSDPKSLLTRSGTSPSSCSPWAYSPSRFCSFPLVPAALLSVRSPFWGLLSGGQPVGLAGQVALALPSGPPLLGRSQVLWGIRLPCAASHRGRVAAARPICESLLWVGSRRRSEAAAACRLAVTSPCGGWLPVTRTFRPSAPFPAQGSGPVPPCGGLGPPGRGSRASGERLWPSPCFWQVQPCGWGISFKVFGPLAVACRGPGVKPGLPISRGTMDPVWASLRCSGVSEATHAARGTLWGLIPGEGPFCGRWRRLSGRPLREEQRLVFRGLVSALGR
jgi:hypothetical protein